MEICHNSHDGYVEVHSEHRYGLRHKLVQSECTTSPQRSPARRGNEDTQICASLGGNSCAQRGAGGKDLDLVEGDVDSGKWMKVFLIGSVERSVAPMRPNEEDDGVNSVGMEENIDILARCEPLSWVMALSRESVALTPMSTHRSLTSALPIQLSDEDDVKAHGDVEASLPSSLV